MQMNLIAGLSVGFMVVPQGMSYAALAGLPSVFGIYGAYLPCLVYCLVGSSKQLSVGPVAVTSLLLAWALQPLIPCVLEIDNPNDLKNQAQVECQNKYNQAAIQVRGKVQPVSSKDGPLVLPCQLQSASRAKGEVLAATTLAECINADTHNIPTHTPCGHHQVCFIVACLYTGMGVLHVGWVNKFLSHAVIGGFTTGAAIIIGIGQVSRRRCTTRRPCKRAHAL